MKRIITAIGVTLGLGLAGFLLYTPAPFLPMAFVDIPAGCFQMGSDPNFEQGEDNERPQHKVCLKGFRLGKYEVTQAEWVAVMGDNPSHFKGQTLPVENVSWDDVQTFIQRLNEKEGGKHYRLPTEAEWEYAARAGTTSPWSCGDDAGCLAGVAWYDANAEGRTHPVGQKQPNPWGLHDMHGNVREWVQDWGGEDYYGNSPERDPQGPESGRVRVYRGGSWHGGAGGLRSANRDGRSPGGRIVALGFRLLRQP